MERARSGRSQADAELWGRNKGIHRLLREKIRQKGAAAEGTGVLIRKTD